MTYYGSNQLAESMRSVRRHTLAIAEDIPEESYDYRPTPETRSVREILLHIASRTQLDLHLHGDDRPASLEGFDFRGFFASSPIHEKLAASKSEILTLLKGEGDRWYALVERLPESLLGEQVGTSRGKKTRFEMLLGTKEHEMHHRGQLMIIERLLGIVPHLTRTR
jgi:uncharacterized damage-inducible protein DinB